MTGSHERNQAKYDRQALLRGEVRLKVLSTIGDFAGLPVGTRIATNHNKLLVLEEFLGQTYWFEDGELTPYQPLVHWLPAYLLPPVVDHKSDEPWPG